MNVPIVAFILAASALALGSMQTKQHDAATETADAFRRCVSDMSLSVMRSEGGKADKNRVVNEVMADCILNTPNDLFSRERAIQDKWMAWAKREVEVQIERDAPKAKVENAAEDQVSADYFVCLERHAKALALTSNQTADIIARASLSSCPAKRRAIFEVHQRYNDSWNERSQDAMDGVLLKRILLEIVAVRARRNAAPARVPETKTSKTPI